MRGRRILSAYSVRLRIDSPGALSVKLITGNESRSSFWTVGCFAFVGRLGIARLTFACTSVKATSVFFSRRNEMETTEMPSEETDDMESMDEMVFTCFSITSVMVVSISSADAPVIVVVIVTIGASTFGI